MRRGRKPLGIDQVDRVPGSPLAKERLRVILANIAGELSIEDACGALGIEPSRLFDLKRRCLEDWVESLEPKTPGRKPDARSAEQVRIDELETRIARLELELKAARLEAELARVVPSRQGTRPPKKRGT
jgi:uncharacterized small protein (DUF1192 family)